MDAFNRKMTEVHRDYVAKEKKIQHLCEKISINRLKRNDI